MSGAQWINTEREKNSLEPLAIIAVNLVSKDQTRGLSCHKLMLCPPRLELLHKLQMPKN